MQETVERTDNNIVIKDRKIISVSGITDVTEFDENMIFVKTENGDLVIEGGELKISVLDTEKKRLEAIGRIDSAIYSDGEAPKKKGLFSRFSK